MIQPPLLTFNYGRDTLERRFTAIVGGCQPASSNHATGKRGLATSNCRFVTIRTVSLFYANKIDFKAREAPDFLSKPPEGEAPTPNA